MGWSTGQNGAQVVPSCKVIFIKGPKEENPLVVTIILTSSCTQQNILD